MGKIAGLSVDRKISKQPVLSDGVAGALPHIHMTPSSKMFVLTKTKFWRDADGNPRPDIPPVILTDKGPCATYCLNYPHSDRGVVVVSYTWGDDSNKVMNTPTAQRLAEFIKVIREVSPEFARHLEEDTIDIIVVDWQKERSQGFALPYPGQEPNPQQLYYQYQSVMPNSGQPNSRVYLIAPLYDGWANSPANGAVNASLAFIQESGGGDTIVDKSPLTHKPKINYG
ncbi:MAG: FAD-dependent oxidoreductase [Burkholderiaceae bacterium]